MPRIQYDLPESFVFSTELSIYTSHINWGGHLDNAQLLGLVGEARARFFRWLDYEEGRVEGCPSSSAMRWCSTNPKRFTAKPCWCI